jgi:hypothetical protein
MAFVRTKKVGEHRYYQLVENYRDGGDGGRHRQRVLAHLGHHDGVEAALEAAREKLEALESGADGLLEQRESAESEARYRELILRKHYRDELNRYHAGGIPTLEEVERRTGSDTTAPKTDEVLEEHPPLYGFPGFTTYKTAVVDHGPEVEEYCRAFADGTPSPREDGPDPYGHTLFYPGLYRYERRIEAFQYWQARAEGTASHYDRKRRRLLARIEKLEALLDPPRGD